MGQATDSNFDSCSFHSIRPTSIPSIHHNTMSSLPMSLPLSVLLSLILCLGFPLLAFPFSSVAKYNMCSLPGKHLHPSSHKSCQQEQHRTQTERHSFMRNDQSFEGEPNILFQSDNDCNAKFDGSNEQGHMQSRRRMMSSIVAGVITSGVVKQQLKHAFAAPFNAATTEDLSQARDRTEITPTQDN